MLMRRTLLRRASSWTFPSLYDQSAMSGKKEKFCRLSTPRKNNRQVKGHFQELFLIYDRNHLIPAASASMMPPIRPPAACGRGADACFPLRAFRTGAVFLLNLRTEQRADTAARKRKEKRGFSFRFSRLALLWLRPSQAAARTRKEKLGFSHPFSRLALLWLRPR